MLPKAVSLLMKTIFVVEYREKAGISDPQPKIAVLRFPIVLKKLA
jgi:hypothetical protein